MNPSKTNLAPDVVYSMRPTGTPDHATPTVDLQVVVAEQDVEATVGQTIFIGSWGN